MLAAARFALRLIFAKRGQMLLRCMGSSQKTENKAR